jgi:plasmid stabilization system protein ParE
MHALFKNPLVDCDLEEAALWYNRRDPAIADRLVDETEKAMRMAAIDPLRFPIRFAEYRRIKIPGFRYALYFKVVGDAVRIVALIHGARDVESVLRARDPSDEP